jgi:flavin reductase (DIM6/NTAB) family NADH-FMN oxidoreductase RutF
MIKKSKQFVINFMPFELKEKVLYCGTHSGIDTNKFKESGFDKEEATKVNCPIIKQCSAFMECKLINEIEADDHVIFIGEVVNSVKKNDKKRIFQCSGKERYNFTTTE